MNVLVTGCGGLIGSEAVLYFGRQGHRVVGIDNNMRREFFGPAGDTTWNLERLGRSIATFESHAVDIRDWPVIDSLFRQSHFDLVIHCAAQPSHDKAKEIPLVDFGVNAVGTVNLLEASRLHSPDAVFIQMSTNKVYGDAPNELPLVELETRYDYASPDDRHGVAETCRIDRCLHSLFGASKAAADLVAQEYGRYFGMKVGIFRGGCLTGPAHSGVELHGFLSYLVKVAVTGKEYTVFGYKGKQVRDQIHSVDVIRAFEAFANNPRPGAVYNLGGGRENSASVLECIAMVEEMTCRPLKRTYVEQNRIGDHICYISDLRKLKSDFPSWSVTRQLKDVIREIVDAQSATVAKGRSVTMTIRPPREKSLVSVVTPAYNQAVFLQETIESVLGQDYPHIEYRVIDDGSTDDTARILKEYDGKIQSDRQSNRGQTPTINKGWSLAKGDVFTWLNSDDTFLPGAVSKAMQFLERNPDVGIVFGRSLYTDEHGTALEPTRDIGRFDYTEFVLGCENPIPQPSAFIRREVVDDIGPLNEKHYYFMDWDYWLRAGSRHKIAYIPEVLSTYRLHAESKTVSQGLKFAADLEWIYREYFESAEVPEKVRCQKRVAMANMYFTSGGYYLRSGDSAAAARMAFRALKQYPELLCSPRLLHKFLYCVLGQNPVYRGSRGLASWTGGLRKEQRARVSYP